MLVCSWMSSFSSTSPDARHGIRLSSFGNNSNVLFVVFLRILGILRSKKQVLKILAEQWCKVSESDVGSFIRRSLSELAKFTKL